MAVAVPFNANALLTPAKPYLPPATTAVAPALVTVNGYVAAPPLMIDPSFHVCVVVPATVAGMTSTNMQSVSESTDDEFQAAPHHLIRGDICTVVPTVAAVALE